MDVPDPTYITATEVKEQTLIAGLVDLTDPQVESLISIAEDQIDQYVGPQLHHYADDNLDRVFPREEDFLREGSGSVIVEYPDTPAIPYRVGRACLRQVEWLYTQWWTDRETALLPMQQELDSVSIGGDGSYSERRARGGTLDGRVSLCEAARELLKGFVSRVAAIDVSDPDLVPDPT